MNGPLSEQRVIVLRTGLSGEGFLKLDLLSEESGIFFALQRIPKNKGAQERPDLFDTARLSLEKSKQSALQFVKIYEAEQHRTRIGHGYTRLQNAANYSRLLILNAAHMPDSGTLFSLAEKSFNAFDENENPEIVLLKSIFLLLRDEGFPVKESWWPGLPAALKASARSLINEPLPEKKAEAPHCTEILKHLAKWIRRETDLYLPEGL